MESKNFQEQILREVTPIGNGAHIFAPKEWLGEEVLLIRIIKKSLKERILEVLDPYLENITGVYLYGSYARSEAKKDSDIDLLVIANKKITIKEKGFEIIILEEDSIKKAIEISPMLIYSALAEAKPIINSDLLNKLKTQYLPSIKHYKSYIEETKNIIKINETLLDPYSIILRLKGIYIINQLMNKSNYSNKKFKSWILEKNPHLDIDQILSSYRKLKNKQKSKILNNGVLKSLLLILKSQTKSIEKKLHEKERKKA